MVQIGGSQVNSIAENKTKIKNNEITWEVSLNVREN